MFTGLIQTVGELTARDTTTDANAGLVLTITTPPNSLFTPDDPCQVGESITINGVCTTVVTMPDAHTFTVFLSPETLAVTTLGELPTGAHINLERAMKASDRFGGHIVTGHIDTQAQVLDIVSDGDSWRVYFRLKDATHGRYLIPKGSIAVDGISLTLNGVQISLAAAQFDVAIIPHTWQVTTFQHLKPGDWVNIEGDTLGKYVAHLLQAYTPTPAEPPAANPSTPAPQTEAFAPAMLGNSQVHTGRWFNLG